MRDTNWFGKQETSQMLLSQRLSKMTTKLIQFVYVVCLISSLDLIAPCQCSQSANSQTSEQTQVHESRKLPDGIESITTLTNLISESNPMYVADEFTKGFQYYNDPIVTTPNYDPPPSIDVPSNHQPVHQFDLKESYYPDLKPVPYVPSSFVPSSNHLVKVTREPFWAPEVYKLENQYVATFRTIKTSVMGFYNKVHDFVNYVMNLFSIENSPLVESRGKKGKFKIKKKFKKFLLPLLIAYKLKFFALIPILIGGLVLLVGSTGMAGFFFALFAAVISLKGGSH